MQSSGRAPIPLSDLLENVRRELARYEHPLFDFEANAAANGVAVQIRFKPTGFDVHTYEFILQPREIELIADFLIQKIVGKGPMNHAKCVEFWGSETDACKDFPK